MAATKVTSAELNPSKTVDANGWTIYDYGSHKVYTYIYTWTGSISVAAAGVYDLPNMNIPAGKTRGDIFLTFTGYCNNRIFLVNERNVSDSATSVNLECNNFYTGAITLTTVRLECIAYDR